MRGPLLAIAAAALFIGLTSRSLPERVASHFDASGAADGFMARGSYLAFMLAAVLLLPLGNALLARWVGRLPNTFINLPNKAYWLAPERRDASLAWLDSWMNTFSIGFAAFFCTVHWLIVRGNALNPPRTEPLPFWTLMSVLFLATGMWIVALYRRFRRVSS